MIAAGLIAAGAGVLVLIAGRLHLMLHLFQLEHYERARLRVWVQRRNARVQIGALALLLVAGVALTVGTAAELDALVLSLGTGVGVALATG